MKKNITAEASRKSTLLSKLVLAPYSVWSAIFIIAPLAFIAYYAFTDDNFNFTFENIKQFFCTKSVIAGDNGTNREVYTYLLIFWRSFKLALISTIICLLAGYPVAYIIARSKPKVQSTLVTLIMIPMWMNFLIRTYAWMTILQDTGIFNNILSFFSIPNIHIIGTEIAVIIGMVYDFFPYMVLPIYSIMAKMDLRLLEAARDLGCNSVGVLRRVIFPLSIPGIISGVTMVLIPSISTFYISQKLGSGKFLLIGDTIEGQYTANNLHFAAAIAFIMMVILLAAMAAIREFSTRKSGGKTR